MGSRSITFNIGDIYNTTHPRISKIEIIGIIFDHDYIKEDDGLLLKIKVKYPQYADGESLARKKELYKFLLNPAHKSTKQIKIQLWK